MAMKNVAHRRKVRALESKRDLLDERMKKTRLELAATRAALKAQRKSKG